MSVTARMYEQDQDENFDEGEDGDEISNEIWQEVSQTHHIFPSRDEYKAVMYPQGG